MADSRIPETSLLAETFEDGTDVSLPLRELIAVIHQPQVARKLEDHLTNTRMIGGAVFIVFVVTLCATVANTEMIWLMMVEIIGVFALMCYLLLRSPHDNGDHHDLLPKDSREARAAAHIICTSAKRLSPRSIWRPADLGTALPLVSEWVWRLYAQFEIRHYAETAPTLSLSKQLRETAEKDWQELITVIHTVDNMPILTSAMSSRDELPESVINALGTLEPDSTREELRHHISSGYSDT